MRNGFDPFRMQIGTDHTSREAIGLLPEDQEEGPEVSVAGRIVAFQINGESDIF